MPMKFKFIVPDGPEYSAEVMLRWEMLSKPLGIPPGLETPAEEQNSLHLVALQGKKIVGCVCFYPESETKGRIFQMAISEEYQGRGFGRQLLHALENRLCLKGIQDVYLHTCFEAEGFYYRMGYEPEGDYFVKLGAKHRLMKKMLKTPNG